MKSSDPHTIIAGDYLEQLDVRGKSGLIENT
jgi:hypothetical protein